MSIALISHPDCLLHEMDSGHPECPERLKAIEDELFSRNLCAENNRHEAPLATREQLYRVHDPEYVDLIFSRSEHDGLLRLDPDTMMNNPGSFRAVLRAAGAAVLGVDLVMSGQQKLVFCNVRPPGHHAERMRAMGFCIFNNIAVGAAHALYEYQLERVAVLDFDVHHGNGTENIFKDDPGVLYCSTFQHPFYPHSGADIKSDHIINVALPAGTKGSEFRAAVKSHWLPALEEFKPKLIFISAGFDAHLEDNMAGLNLIETDFAWVTTKLRRIADQYASGRIVSVLEGGYALPALGRSVAAHVEALSGKNRSDISA
jgi:acetoin utilization deacetylase AcuC-like enzyme